MFLLSWSSGLNTYSVITESTESVGKIFIQCFKSLSCDFPYLTSIGGQNVSLYNILISNPRFSLSPPQLSSKLLISLCISSLIYSFVIKLPKILNHHENWIKIYKVTQSISIQNVSFYYYSNFNRMYLYQITNKLESSLCICVSIPMTTYII